MVTRVERRERGEKEERKEKKGVIYLFIIINLCVCNCLHNRLFYFARQINYTHTHTHTHTHTQEVTLMVCVLDGKVSA